MDKIKEINFVFQRHCHSYSACLKQLSLVKHFSKGLTLFGGIITDLEKKK